MSPGQDLVGDLDIGFKSFSWVQHHSIRLLNTMRTCSKCCPTQVTSTEITSKQDAASLASSEDTDKIREYNIRPTPRVSAIAIPCEDLSDTADDEILLGDYDDYASSPIESWDDDRLLGIWTFQNGQTILPSCWTVWKDRGYRLPKNFFNTLPLRPPSGHHEHFLPFLTGIDDPDPTEADHASDCLMLSARQMLDEAGQIPGTAESLRVFVKGVERSQDRKERFIKIDLNADAVPIPDGNIDISVDLDSMMWVTDAKSFRIQSMELRQTPSIRQKPAFANNNFIYVNVVCPPTTLEEVQRPGERTRANFKLSRIPHMDLGYSGEGDKRVNIYVFFPRMIRQDSGTKRYRTLVPQTVQELWLDRVILPSCQDVFGHGVGFSEYLSPTVKTIQDRSGDQRKQKSITVCGSNTEKIMKHMATRVKESSDLLGCFGSFFVVADARGMKLATKQCVEGPLPQGQSYAADFTSVKSQFNNLLWDHMLDRKNGELYLDLGVSFHPRWDEPVVGLWKLPKLQASYELMDMKAGTVHHFNTFGAYGGLKSESKLKRRQVTHLISRLSYCLAFEMVRNPGAEEYLCSDKDIAECGQKFIAACRRWTDLFELGEHRSFGVRDELRGIGCTILDLLDISLNKATAYLSSGPIIWIRSTTFFQFLGRRLTEVKNLQISCYKERVPNYCLISAVNGYLLRHVMVTPLVKNRYLAEALRDLRSREIMATFGAFFLHNLDTGAMYLPDISQEDNAEMRKLMGDPLARLERGRKVAPPPPLALTLDGTLGDYPWGEFISSNRLKDLLETVPEQFLKEYQSDEFNLSNDYTGDLFVAFSQQIWLPLSSVAIGRHPPYPITLDQAVSMWNFTELRKYCASIELLQCTFGLQGIQSRAATSQLSFGERRSIFFPSPENYASYSGHWKSFGMHETGYISMYHNILKRSTQQVAEILNADLDLIFSGLQCLPLSSGDPKKGTIWTSHHGRVQFITNPKCYPIRGIGKEPPTKTKPTHRLQIPKKMVDRLFHERIYGVGSYKHARKRVEKPRRNRKVGLNKREGTKGKGKGKRKKYVPDVESTSSSDGHGSITSKTQSLSLESEYE
ncbi:hypothetical protein GALMADRAFT_148904 [Galerina marginata CBS 339.88]|uniref:Uncharacterized protein n=1 Tax=Galerina marginata (strain CBS 339.88) TaxID=685588 RepID=A0A067S317_GALM3|nr:hypothetical protein GALMADRAFT_148904 [Galerina marginata CBS 339.88]